MTVNAHGAVDPTGPVINLPAEPHLIWVSRRQVVGTFAMWACRQSPYGVPDNLEEVCRYLYDALLTFTEWCPGGFIHEWAQVEVGELRRWLDQTMIGGQVTAFEAWNRRRRQPTPDEYDRVRDPDTDFIDLHALLRNTVSTLAEEATRA